MSTNPKISVIIPVYKVEPYLRQCLDSVVTQMYHNLEIIIIDDGSPDSCGMICDEYAQRDGRIQVIHKENGGLCAARNDGINHSTGEWLTFVDSDDWIDPEYYGKMVDSLKDDTVDIACSRGHVIEDPIKSVEMHAFEGPAVFEDSESRNYLFNKTLVPNTKDGFAISAGTVWDKFFRRSFVCQKNLLFDMSSKAWEDLWFSLQAFKKARKVTATAIIGYHYRMVPGSITKSFNSNRPQINYDFICKAHSLLREQDSIVRNSLNARAIGLIMNSLRFCYFHPANDKSGKEITKEIKEMMSWPYYKEAIWSDNHQFLRKKQIVFKYTLRLPWIWPLKLMYDVNEKMKKAG